LEQAFQISKDGVSGEKVMIEWTEWKGLVQLLVILYKYRVFLYTERKNNTI